MKIQLTAEEEAAVRKLIVGKVKADIVLSNGDIVKFWPTKHKFSLRIDYTSGVCCNQGGAWKEGLEYLGLGDLWTT